MSIHAQRAQSHLEKLRKLHNQIKRTLSRFTFLDRDPSFHSAFCSHYIHETENLLDELLIRGKVEFENLPKSLRVSPGMYGTAFTLSQGNTEKFIKYLRIMMDDIIYISKDPKSPLYSYVMDDVLYLTLNRLDFIGYWEDEGFVEFMAQELSPFVEKLSEGIRGHSIVSE